MLPGKKYTPDEILQIVRSHKWLLVLPFVVGLAGSILIARWIPQRFRSETLIMVVPQRVSETLVKPTVNDRMEDRLLSISDQIQSRSRLERIIADFDLYQDKRRRGMIMEDVVAL